ncbi:beta-fructofuranosidase [Anaerocolumna xylanovorans DSM 12503]|uniref:Sucrose-6-phosphate hydrolase n=2 Tax=Anaerocolumna TaxID=1843210 RepID=A0A1M7XXW8_9FIRM|nr:beta-fructofuranosidase [Anaerocolumna xylanovorans DSM 12503]
MLENARKYERDGLKQIPEGQKPSFHVCAPVGWINDPNGFSVYKGEYHLFYQYHPYKTVWGPMHWGHSKSKDFIKWEQLPCALAPDTGYDGQGCFSGSAVEHDGKHMLMYTGVLNKVQEDGTRLLRQTQCIAVGDGVNYEKLDTNPVITGDFLPEGSSREDFRDPKIWIEGEDFYAVIGSRSEETGGQIVLFTSQDAKNWKYAGIIEESRNEYGEVWECPDFFYIDGKQVLLISPTEMMADGLEFHNGNSTIYILGDYDKGNHKLIRERVAAIDYGLDFYAPQTLETADGRRIMVAWMQSWDNYLTPPSFQWSGLMTVPRELHVKNGLLYQNPVRELENYYQKEVKYDAVTINGEKEPDGIKGRQFDLTVEVEARDYEEFAVRFAADDKYYSILRYNPKANTVTFDRTYSGLRKDILHKRSINVKEQKGKIKLRILMDKYTVEVFVNDGEQAMTSLIYTPLEADRIRFLSKGEVKCSIVKYDVAAE